MRHAVSQKDTQCQDLCSRQKVMGLKVRAQSTKAPAVAEANVAVVADHNMVQDSEIHSNASGIADSLTFAGLNLV